MVQRENQGRENDGPPGFQIMIQARLQAGAEKEFFANGGDECQLKHVPCQTKRFASVEHFFVHFFILFWQRKNLDPVIDGRVQNIREYQADQNCRDDSFTDILKIARMMKSVVFDEQEAWQKKKQNLVDDDEFCLDER